MSRSRSKNIITTIWFEYSFYGNYSSMSLNLDPFDNSTVTQITPPNGVNEKIFVWFAIKTAQISTLDLFLSQLTILNCHCHLSHSSKQFSKPSNISSNNCVLVQAIIDRMVRTEKMKALMEKFEPFERIVLKYWNERNTKTDFNRQ